MQRLLPVAVTFAVLLAPLAATSNPARACSCYMGTVQERVERSALVFIGEVTGFGDSEATFVSLPMKSTILRVERYLKGSGGAELEVADSTGGSAACGYFSGSQNEIGQRYLLFVHEDPEGNLVTSLCSGNISLEGDVGADAMVVEIEMLTGPGHTPGGVPPQGAVPEGEKDPPWAVILPLAFGIPLATLLVPVFFRRGGAGH
jgi:hypothetical protein